MDINNKYTELNTLIQNYKKQSWFQKNASTIAPVLTMVTIGFLLLELRFFRPVPAIMIAYILIDVVFVIATTFFIRMYFKSRQTHKTLMVAIKKAKDHPQKDILQAFAKKLKSNNLWSGIMAVLMCGVILFYTIETLKIALLMPMVLIGGVVWFIFYRWNYNRAKNQLFDQLS